MRLIFLCIAFASAFALPAHAAPAKPASEAVLYAECTALVGKNATEALKNAEDWGKKTGSLSASHCKAIALFELGQFAESAQTLDSLARGAAKNKPALLLDIAKQASTAWQKSGQSQKAIESISYAANVAQEAERKKDLSAALLERARLYKKHNQPLGAMQDLDHLLSLDAADKTALLERAHALVLLKQPALARADAMRVLQLEPGNTQAQQLLTQTK